MYRFFSAASWVFKKAATSRTHHKRLRYVLSQQTSMDLEFFTMPPMFTTPSLMSFGSCWATQILSTNTVLRCKEGFGVEGLPFRV